MQTVLYHEAFTAPCRCDQTCSSSRSACWDFEEEVVKKDAEFSAASILPLFLLMHKFWILEHSILPSNISQKPLLNEADAEGESCGYPHGESPFPPRSTDCPTMQIYCPKKRLVINYLKTKILCSTIIQERAATSTLSYLQAPTNISVSPNLTSQYERHHSSNYQRFARLYSRCIFVGLD